MSAYGLSLQLYTVRDQTARDFAGTIRQVAKIGYPAIETGGYNSAPIEEMQQLLAETGLRVDATLGQLTVLETQLEREIEFCRAVGSSYIVLSWLHPHERTDVVGLGQRLNAIGARLREQGIAFAYHNHDFEFEQIDGVYFLDRLLAATDPSHVQLQLDVYWAAKGGVDPVAYLRRYAGRVPLVHLKDMAADRSFANIGEGTLDMEAIIRAALDGGAKWLIVENDQPRPPSLESARISLENLRALLAKMGV